MIRITVELVPLGDESRARIIGKGVIANDGSGTLTSGNYNAGFGEVRDDREAIERTYRSGRVEGFPRTRLNVWDLLYRALRDAVGERNPS